MFSLLSSPSFSFSFFFLLIPPLNKSQLLSRALLRVRVWIPSQIIPERLKGGRGMSSLFDGRAAERPARSAALLLPF